MSNKGSKHSGKGTSSVRVTKKSAPLNKSSSPSSVEMDKNWEVESALSTLERADEIKNDPNMMSRVKEMAIEKAKRLKKFTR